MNFRKPLVTVCMMCLAAVSAMVGDIAPAAADLRIASGQFVFNPTLTDKGDPVTLLFAGGTISEPNPGGTSPLSCTGKGPQCAALMLKRHWVRGDMTGRVCNGSGLLGFLGNGNQTVSQDKNVSTSVTCKRQFHMRIWGDSYHGHTTPVWNVAGIHHETRGDFSGPHVVDMSWETVEHIAVLQLGVHHQGVQGAFCTYPNYQRVIGSGPGKIHGRYSDGKISRISFHWIDHGGCAGS
jgi:hypothetical protein